MIRTEGLARNFGRQVALAPLDIVFERGRTSVLLGPSGCGKSTLLRLLIGLLQADAGRVELDGEWLEASKVERMRQRTGYVIQDGGLFPHLTARENITLLARYLGWPAERIATRLDAVIASTRIDPAWLDQYPATLSGGERQRVGLARALMHDPPLLLCDEPLSALDPITRSALQQELRDLFDRLGKTVIWVTHDLHEAAWLSQDIVLMRNGRVVQRGSITDLMAHPAEPFVAQFINAQRGHLPAAAGA